MRIQISTVLHSQPERIWKELQMCRLLFHVASPVVVFEAINPSVFPEFWSDGKYQVRMWLFGFIPLGKQWIVIQHQSMQTGYGLLDDGYGDIIQVWRHLITLNPTPEGFTQYTDTVDIEAGWLTIGAWMFANLFYRHRQNRWRHLVDGNFRFE